MSRNIIAMLCRIHLRLGGQDNKANTTQVAISVGPQLPQAGEHGDQTAGKAAYQDTQTDSDFVRRGGIRDMGGEEAEQELRILWVRFMSGGVHGCQLLQLARSPPHERQHIENLAIGGHLLPQLAAHLHHRELFAVHPQRTGLVTPVSSVTIAAGYKPS